MDIFIGPRVLRIRLLRPSPTRRFAPKVETLSALRVRHDKAVDLLERRKAAWLDGVSDLSLLENQIHALGYEFQDEESAEDGRYSFWRRT